MIISIKFRAKTSLRIILNTSLNVIKTPFFIFTKAVKLNFNRYRKFV